MVLGIRYLLNPLSTPINDDYSSFFIRLLLVPYDTVHKGTTPQLRELGRRDTSGHWWWRHWRRQGFGL